MNHLIKFPAIIAVSSGVIWATSQSIRASRLEQANQQLRAEVESKPQLPSRMRDMRRQSHKSDPWEEMSVMYQTYSNRKGGDLSEEAAKAASLSDDEKTAVTDTLRRTWVDASNDFSSRATLVDQESSEENGVVVYMIPARLDRGAAYRETLTHALDRDVGPSKRRILMAGMQAGETFGGFGAYDIRLEFSTVRDEFKFAMMLASDGQTMLSGSDPLAEFSNMFGNSFEIPKFTAENGSH